MKRDAELVFVTGAGSGIGRAAALRFGRLGAVVLPTDIDPHTAEQTAQLVRSGGGRASAYQLDVSDAAAFETLAARVQAEHGVPDVVVNNAGMLVAGTFLEHSMDDWRRVLGVHLMGVVHGCRLFGAQMVDRGRGGHLVNVSSMASFGPFPYGSSYCTAKAAIAMASQCLRAELAPHGIGVRAMCFGLINTSIAAAADLLATEPELLDAGKRASAWGMPRFGADPDRAARAIASAVRHNRAIVPVRPEAWVGAGVARLSPGLIRFAMTRGARLATRENAERLSRLIPGGAR